MAQGTFRMGAIGCFAGAMVASCTKQPRDVAARLAVAPPSSATAAVSPAPIEVVIYDPRNDAEDPKVKTLVGKGKLSAPEQKRLLDRVFGAGRYLADRNACRDASSNLASARASGDFAPSVFEVASGSFTTPNSKQDLYLIGNGECGAGHVDNWGTMTLAVLDRGAVVARANIVGGSSLHSVFDIDGDGRSEILVTTGSTNMGSTVESAELFRFDADKLTELKSFPSTYSGTCSGALEPGNESFAVIRAVTRRGAAPEYKVERVSRRCR